MKKFVIFALTVALMLGLTLTAFAADADIALAAKAETVKVGEQIVVTLSVSDLPEATSGNFTITVPAGLEFVKKGSAWLVEDTTIANINVSKATGVFAIEEAADINGDVATFVFNTTAASDKAFNISVNFKAKNGSEDLIDKTVEIAVKVVCAEHAFGDFVVTTPAKCGVAGVKTATCSACGETKTEAIAALQHAFGDFVVTTPAKCGVAGVKTATCSACGETKTEAIAALQHAFGDFVVTTPAKCGVAGVKTATCSACGETKTEAIAALEHTYGEFEVTTEAACGVAGVKTATCSACGDKITEEIAALEHAYGEFVVVTPATETSVGKQEKTCSLCGDVVAEEIPMLEPDNNPPTGDNVAIVVMIAMVAMAGAVVVFKKRSF